MVLFWCGVAVAAAFLAGLGIGRARGASVARQAGRAAQLAQDSALARRPQVAATVAKAETVYVAARARTDRTTRAIREAVQQVAGDSSCTPVVLAALASVAAVEAERDAAQNVAAALKADVALLESALAGEAARTAAVVAPIAAQADSLAGALRREKVRSSVGRIAAVALFAAGVVVGGGR